MSERTERPAAVAPLDSQEALAWALKAVLNHDRQRRFKRQYAYFYGVQDLQFATPKFLNTFGSLFAAFAYNRCRPVVEAHTDRLFLESFDTTDDRMMREQKAKVQEAENKREDAPTAQKNGVFVQPTPPPKELNLNPDGTPKEVLPEQSAISKQIETMLGRNHFDEIQMEVYQAAMITGEAYVLVWPDAREDDPELDAGKPIAAIIPQPPEQCAVRFSELNPSDVEVGAKVWRDRKGFVRCNVYFNDRIERWVANKPSKEAGRIPRPQDMRPYSADGAAAVIPHDYEVVPLVPFLNQARTGMHEGLSELTDVIPLQNALNKQLTDMMVTSEFMAYPQRVLIGVDASNDPYAPKTAGGTQADQVKQFSAGIARLLTLSSPNSKIGEFSSADLAQFTEVAEYWEKAICRVTKIPEHYLTMTGDFPSGRAMRAAEAPYVAKLTAMQRQFSNPWESVVRIGLRVEKSDYKDKISAKWRSAAPMADEDQWDLVTQMTDVEVPLDIALAEIGWPPDKIAQVKARRDALKSQEAEMFRLGHAPLDDDPLGNRNPAPRRPNPDGVTRTDGKKAPVG